jgi:hypothetical protein
MRLRMLCALIAGFVLVLNSGCWCCCHRFCHRRDNAPCEGCCAAPAADCHCCGAAPLPPQAIVPLPQGTIVPSGSK